MCWILCMICWYELWMWLLPLMCFGVMSITLNSWGDEFVRMGYKGMGDGRHGRQIMVLSDQFGFWCCFRMQWLQVLLLHFFICHVSFCVSTLKEASQWLRSGDSGFRSGDPVWIRNNCWVDEISNKPLMTKLVPRIESSYESHCIHKGYVNWMVILWCKLDMCCWLCNLSYLCILLHC